LSPFLFDIIYSCVTHGRITNSKVNYQNFGQNFWNFTPRNWLIPTLFILDNINLEEEIPRSMIRIIVTILLSLNLHHNCVNAISHRPGFAFSAFQSIMLKKRKRRRHHETENSSNQRLSLHSDIPQQSNQDIPSRRKIYCDLDGVLCDFDAAVRDLSKGIPADLLPHRYMWSLIAKSEKFYERLPWTTDGQVLWNNIKHLQPTILTGVSMGKTCPIEKATWCSRELCVPTNHVCKASPGFQHTIVKGDLKYDAVNVITCWSKNKHFESGVGS
jgi:hypothetical protein